MAALAGSDGSQAPFPLLRSFEAFDQPVRRGISPDGFVVWEQLDRDGDWRAYLSGPGTGARRIVKSDDPIPDRPGLTISRLGFEAWPGPGGRVLFRTWVGPDLDPIRLGWFLYQSNRLTTLAIGGERVPGQNDLWFPLELNSIPIPNFTSQGDCALRLPVSDNPKDPIGKLAFFVISDDQLRMVLRAGGTVPDDPLTEVNHVDSIHSTRQHGLFFAANLQSPIADWECLWQLEDSRLRPRIVFDRRLDRGTPAPGTDGRRFVHLELGPQTGIDGSLAFTAETMAPGVTTGRTLTGLWAGPPEQLELRVQPGDSFDGQRPGKITSFFGEPVPGANRSIAFVGQYNAPVDPQLRNGVFLSRNLGDLELVMWSGMPAPGLEDRWKIFTNSFQILSSFGAGRFLVSVRVEAEGEFSRSGLLVLDEEGHWKPIAYQQFPLKESTTGETITGFISSFAGWENGLGQRRLVTENGLMILPLFGTKIGEVMPSWNSLYFVQLQSGSSRLTATASAEALPGQWQVQAELETGKAYQWEWASLPTGPWTRGELFWAGESPLKHSRPIDLPHTFLRLSSP